jgi:hypothetical protein
MNRKWVALRGFLAVFASFSAFAEIACQASSMPLPLSTSKQYFPGLSKWRKIQQVVARFFKLSIGSPGRLRA